MKLEDALLSQKSTSSSKHLFYSVEPTQASHSEGRYLLLTNKDLIQEAEVFIDSALQSLNGHPENHAKVMLADSPITRANRIESSTRFQTYAAKLKGMIPTTINTVTPTGNAWKRRTPTLLNLSDAAFPLLDSPKKQRTGKNTTHDSATTTTESTTSLTDIDIDAIESKQKDITDALAQQIQTLREESATMQRTMQEKFQESLTAMNNLEIRLEQRVQMAITSLSHTVQTAVDTMNAHSARSEDRLAQFLRSFQDQADRMAQQVDRMFQTQPGNQHPMDELMSTTPYGTPERPHSRPCTRTTPIDDDRPHVPTTWDMDDDPLADGSLKSSASHASPPTKGPDASTGGHE
jgi:hypothetical protein